MVIGNFYKQGRGGSLGSMAGDCGEENPEGHGDPECVLGAEDGGTDSGL